MTDKQKRFIAEYLIDSSATQAAIRAGYSPKTAKAQGSRLLTDVDIAAELQAKQEKKLDELDLTAKRVLSEIMALGFLDVGALFDERGNFRPIQDLPVSVRKAIASVEVVKRNLTAGDDKQDEIIKLRLWDKNKALEMLCKNLNLFRETIEHTGGIELTWKS